MYLERREKKLNDQSCGGILKDILIALTSSVKVERSHLGATTLVTVKESMDQEQYGKDLHDSDTTQQPSQAKISPSKMLKRRAEQKWKAPVPGLVSLRVFTVAGDNSIFKQLSFTFLDPKHASPLRGTV